MRTIKYRAWDKEGVKGLREVVEIDFDKKIARVLEDRGRAGRVMIWLPFSRIELVQFTGLLDAKGQEIYEGDICASKLNQHFPTVNAEVKWIENVAAFQLAHPNAKSISNTKAVEVVGNIYENNELLS